jgi:hypothetical protein
MEEEAGQRGSYIFLNSCQPRQVSFIIQHQPPLIRTHILQIRIPTTQRDPGIPRLNNEINVHDCLGQRPETSEHVPGKPCKRVTRRDGETAARGEGIFFDRGIAADLEEMAERPTWESEGESGGDHPFMSTAVEEVANFAFGDDQSLETIFVPPKSRNWEFKISIRTVALIV